MLSLFLDDMCSCVGYVCVSSVNMWHALLRKSECFVCVVMILYYIIFTVSTIISKSICYTNSNTMGLESVI